MAELAAALDALVQGLAEACPGRLVSRSFRPLAQIPQEDLERGVLTVMLRGERDWKNYRGREADLGTLNVTLVGQLVVAADAGGVGVEAAEMALAREIKTFLGTPLPAPLRACLAPGYDQSGQLDTPYGWVVFELEVMA